MSIPAESFEDEFTRVFATETLSGTLVRLVGLSYGDAQCDETDTAENSRTISPELIFRQVRDSEEFLARHLPWVRGVTASEIAKRMRSWIFAEQYCQGGCWGILYEGSLGGFIMAEFNLKNRSATLSYWLLEKFTGKGLMTDAVKTLSAFCCDVLKLNRLELSVSVRNEKSMAVASRAGFIEEGVLRDYEWINGSFVDHRRYSLLSRDSWKILR